MRSMFFVRTSFAMVLLGSAAMAAAGCSSADEGEGLGSTAQAVIGDFLPGLQVDADVLAEADYTGSTAGMIDWVRKHNPKRVVMVTECSMADNVKAELPGVEFVRPCNFCPHMKRITLLNILHSLVYLKEEVVIDPAVAARARRSVERMVNLKR